MERFLKTAVISLQFFLLSAIAAVIYGFFVRSTFTPVYIFDAGFLVGAGIMIIGLFMLLVPVLLRFSKLTDHTTYVERFMDARDERQAKAYDNLYLGMMIIAVTATVQLIVSFIVR